MNMKNLQKKYKTKPLKIKNKFKPFKVSYFEEIDWNKVKNDGWNGIAIIPYLDEYFIPIELSKNEECYSWLTTWDCESVVIWNFDCILNQRIINLEDYYNKLFNKEFYDNL